MTLVEKVTRALDTGKIVVGYIWTYEKPSTVSQQVFFWINFIKWEYVVIYIVYHKAIYHPEDSMLYITNVI